MTGSDPHAGAAAMVRHQGDGAAGPGAPLQLVDEVREEVVDMRGGRDENGVVEAAERLKDDRLAERQRRRPRCIVSTSGHRLPDRPLQVSRVHCMAESR
jgi:hypothetical protein